MIYVSKLMSAFSLSASLEWAPCNEYQYVHTIRSTRGPTRGQCISLVTPLFCIRQAGAEQHLGKAQEGYEAAKGKSQEYADAAQQQGEGVWNKIKDTLTGTKVGDIHFCPRAVVRNAFGSTLKCGRECDFVFLSIPSTGGWTAFRRILISMCACVRARLGVVCWEGGIRVNALLRTWYSKAQSPSRRGEES
jgi:hypothetical protein